MRALHEHAQDRLHGSKRHLNITDMSLHSCPDQLRLHITTGPLGANHSARLCSRQGRHGREVCRWSSSEPCCPSDAQVSHPLTPTLRAKPLCSVLDRGERLFLSPSAAQILPADPRGDYRRAHRCHISGLVRCSGRASDLEKKKMGLAFAHKAPHHSDSQQPLLQMMQEYHHRAEARVKQYNRRGGGGSICCILFII